jgi:hypothetical protein
LICDCLSEFELLINFLLVTRDWGISVQSAGSSSVAALVELVVKMGGNFYLETLTVSRIKTSRVSPQVGSAVRVPIRVVRRSKPLLMKGDACPSRYLSEVVLCRIQLFLSLILMEVLFLIFLTAPVLVGQAPRSPCDPFLLLSPLLCSVLLLEPSWDQRKSFLRVRSCRNLRGLRWVYLCPMRSSCEYQRLFLLWLLTSCGGNLQSPELLCSVRV